MIYPFVESPRARESIEGSKGYFYYQLLQEKQGYSNLTKNEKEEIINFFSDSISQYDLNSNGFYKVLGWVIDFREHLKTYIVKDKYSGWIERKAFNKTHARKAYDTPSRIIKIVEITE